MKYKVFISQPMTGRSVKEITAERQSIIDFLEQLNTGLSNLGLSVEVINAFNVQAFTSNIHPLLLIGDCIKKMSEADIVVFANGWTQSKGCRIEHQCAVDYGLSVIML